MSKPFAFFSPMLTSAIINHWIILTPWNYYYEVEIFSKAIIRVALKMKLILPKPVT